MLIDTHAHLDDRQFDKDRAQMFERAQKAGVKCIVNVGYDMASSQRSVDLSKQYDFVYAAVGIHPHDAKEANAQAYEKLKIWAKEEKVVALGEMGLDYYRDLSPRPIQKEAFCQQIRLAREIGLPIIVHDRDAHEDIIRVLKEEKAETVGGVLHCFSGSWEMAKECIKMGFYISLAGPVTFGNARKLQEVAQKLPLDKLLVETDSPYLTPEPHRGKRNESAHVRFMAEKIAELKGISFEELAEATTQNACKVFGLRLG